MEEICGGNKPYLSTAVLETHHLRIQEKSLDKFDSRRKMGGAEFSHIYRTKLEEDIEESFGHFKQFNESKNIFKAARTPAVFSALAIIFYILSGVFGLLGVYSIANSCNLFMGLALLTLIMWAYIRYSGELHEIGILIDDYATFLWENVCKNLNFTNFFDEIFTLKFHSTVFEMQFMKPVYQQVMEKSIHDAVVGKATELAMNNVTKLAGNNNNNNTKVGNSNRYQQQSNGDVNHLWRIHIFFKIVKR